MSKPFVSSIPLSEFELWHKIEGKRSLISFALEITARCNNNCSHCCVNLPARDKGAEDRELSFEEIQEICDEVVSLGAFWCLLTGGEPLLREDFFDIYIYLKKKGLLISVFTNAALITNEHVKLFKKYPPRDIEVSVYGATQATYENGTRTPGSFNAFMRGLELLLKSGVKVRLKAMALRSNIHEFREIARFCRSKTKDYFRFDPFLHLRYDSDPTRNEEIRSQRLTPEEIGELERSDEERFRALKRECGTLNMQVFSNETDNRLFRCGAGYHEFVLSYDGLFRLCSSLWHPDCVYNLRKGSLSDAWKNFVPNVLETASQNEEIVHNCRACPLISLCMWCPALAHLETGRMDSHVEYFCEVAHARVKQLKNLT